MVRSKSFLILYFEEWSKSSNKYDPTSDRRDSSRRENKSVRDVKCYNCDRRGHYARDCRSKRRSRSPRGGRDRDDSYRRGHRDEDRAYRSPRRDRDDS